MDYTKTKMGWIDVNDSLPEENETVWAYSVYTNFVALAAVVYGQGWLWAISNGTIYIDNGKIVSECESGDDYEFTHWQPLPRLPIIP